MKTTVLGLRTAIYQVGDITSAKEWYAEVFETQPYFDEPFYVGFEIGGYELGLQPEENPSRDKTESVVAYWGVDDVREVFDRFLTLGALEYEQPEEVGGGIIVAKVKDPWGNIIGLIYNPHFKVGS
ncbi:VOC family protein [Chitinophaga agrisoli]|uniref:VOC family protein n=1 Tax=Chitinophaga agrisoli TaxID=2607653 RepID=A0A5B2VYB0_9BACT|nr:VOC family protein [Chitinophaga agrisoli]KAA2244843.1 VOC family protein [Chitinophaga agrisoli]